MTVLLKISTSNVVGICPAPWLENRASVVGFPGEYEGEKWGMTGEIPIQERKNWTFKKSYSQETSIQHMARSNPEEDVGSSRYGG